MCPQKNKNEVVILSWNVNGIRANYKKGFFDWFQESQPDILCLQEVRATEDQIPKKLYSPEGYYAYWNSAERPGYSGTALLSKEKPINVTFGLGIAEFDNEGRTIIAEYNDFFLIGCYFPNGGQENKRVPYKLEFYRGFIDKCEELRRIKTIIFCGDVNTSHKEIDLANPKSNMKNTGFLPEERAWIDEIIEKGYVDTFRYFNPEKTEQYTWWSALTKARERNKGWRLDYFFVNIEDIERIKESFILADVMGSDHCPVGIRLKIKN